MSEESGSTDRLEQVIRRLAEKTGKSTQEAQAASLGVSDTALSKYLSGDQIPRERTFVKMLTSVKIPTDEHLKYLAILKSAKAATGSEASRESGRFARVSLEDGPSRGVGRSKQGVMRRMSPMSIYVKIGVVVVCMVCGLVAWLLLPSSESGATPSAAPTLATSARCALVNAPSSPVFAEIGDLSPVKFKNSGDQVRLVPSEPRTGADGVVYQAVALPDPRDSSTGIGWMPKADLTLDPPRCAGPGKRS